MKALVLSFILIFGSIAQAKVFCESNSGRTHVSIYFNKDKVIAGYRMSVASKSWSGVAAYISESLEPSLGEEKQTLVYTTDHFVAEDSVFSTDLVNSYRLSMDVNHRAGHGYAGEIFNVASFNSVNGSVLEIDNGMLEYDATLDIRFDDKSPWGLSEDLGDLSKDLGLSEVVARQWKAIKLICNDDGQTGDLPGVPGPEEG